MVDPAGIFAHRLCPGALASGDAGCKAPNRRRPVIERLWKRTTRGAPSPLLSVNPLVRDRQPAHRSQDLLPPIAFKPGEIESPERSSATSIGGGSPGNGAASPISLLPRT
jgi:hypothetical protein